MNIDHVRAHTHIQQLQKSERGEATLAHLAKLLGEESTRSLDQHNQIALTHLIAYSLKDPYIRDMVQRATTPKKAHVAGGPPIDL